MRRNEHDDCVEVDDQFERLFCKGREVECEVIDRNHVRLASGISAAAAFQMGVRVGEWRGRPLLTVNDGEVPG